MLSEKEKLDKLTFLGIELNQVRDLDILMERVLEDARRFVNFEIMKQHTYLRAKLFLDSQSNFDETAFDVALNHHERWDGRGYPGHIDMESYKPIPRRSLA